MYTPRENGVYSIILRCVIVSFIVNLYRSINVWRKVMQTCLSCGIELALLVKGTDGYCKKCDPSLPTSVVSPVEGKGLSNLLIGKSHLGDFGRSLGVFGFYQAMLFIIVSASDASYEAAAALGFLWAIGMLLSTPAALIFFGILFFARALNKDFLRKAAIVWFFAFPALVLVVLLVVFGQM